MSCIKHVECEEETINFAWDVNFDEKRGDSIYSPVFKSAIKVTAVQWKLKLGLYKDLNSKDNISYLSCYLCNQSAEPVIAKFQLSLLDDKESEVHSKKLDLYYNFRRYRSGHAESNWGFPNWCKYNDFKHIIEDCNYKIKLRATVWVITHVRERTITLSEMNRDMEKLLQSKEHADVTFCVKGEELRAHRAIVSARCRVLGQMVASTERAEVQDVEPAVFQQLLRFIYTEQVDLEAVDVEELFKLADSTDLARLRERCQKHLMKTLTTDNCLRVLKLAESCSENTLSEIVTDYVVDNLADVRKGADWSAFIKDNPDIIFKIFEKLKL